MQGLTKRQLWALVVVSLGTLVAALVADEGAATFVKEHPAFVGVLSSVATVPAAALVAFVAVERAQHAASRPRAAGLRRIRLFGAYQASSALRSQCESIQRLVRHLRGADYVPEDDLDFPPADKSEAEARVHAAASRLPHLVNSLVERGAALAELIDDLEAAAAIARLDYYLQEMQHDFEPHHPGFAAALCRRLLKEVRTFDASFATALEADGPTRDDMSYWSVLPGHGY